MEFTKNSGGEIDPLITTEELVGRKLRFIRTKQGFSLRALADRSGLNINTLSSIENGKTSPSVSTLQQLAQTLGISIADFFDIGLKEKQIIFTSGADSPKVVFGSTTIQNMGKDLAGASVQPFVITFQQHNGSGDQEVSHSGHEFVYCLNGRIHYRINQDSYTLDAGDSLLFEAHLPHSWENEEEEPAQILLIIFPSDNREDLGGKHFSINTMKREIHMKIAAITDDGMTISQHFGRAQYYLVLTIEEGKIVHREMRPKIGHGQFSNQPHGQEQHGAGHGLDADSHNKHVSMAESIADCSVLLCGGMGMGAYESMRRLNIKPVISELRQIDAAVIAFIEGKLIDHTELLH